MIRKFFAFAITALAAPGVVFAAADLISIGKIILGLFSALAPVVLGLALLGFMWGGAMYIFSAGNDKKRAEAKHVLTYGVIALFFALSFLGMVAIIQNTFDLNSTDTLQIPSAKPPF